MEVIKIILLILAYTIGIATVMVQILCYLKGIEYKETLIFTISFMLLILMSTVSEFNLMMGNNANTIIDAFFNLFIIILSATIPINIHSERIVSNSKMKNRIIIGIAIILFIILISGYLFSFSEEAQIIITVLLNLSIIYSMLVIMTAKPSLLLKHREKAERRIAKIFLVSIPSYILLGLVLRYVFQRESFLFDGVIILTLIFIALALSKLTDDLKRLSLFSEKNKCGPEKLSVYKITQRESEVVNLLIKGKSYKEICEELFISMPTVKTHVSNIYMKMNINNKVELINLISD